MRPDEDDANEGRADPALDGVRPAARSHAERTTEKLELLEETARVDIVEHVTGRVQVRTRTETIEESVDTVLESVTAEVERVRIDRYLDEGELVPRARQEGDTWIVPVLEEVVVVQKRLHFKEEIRVTQRGDRQNVSVPVSVRRQVAEVERMPPTDDSTVETTGAGGHGKFSDKP